MSEGVYKGVTVVGTSTESFSEAIRVAIERAQQTIHELRWFEIRDQRAITLRQFRIPARGESHRRRHRRCRAGAHAHRTVAVVNRRQVHARDAVAGAGVEGVSARYRDSSVGLCQAPTWSFRVSARVRAGGR